MSCFVESMEEFNITWYKDGSAFIPSLSDLYHLTDGGQTLHVLRADEDHDGNYTCRAANEAGTDSQTFTVNVLTPARADPSAEAEADPDGTFLVEVPNDSELQLECHASGNPEPALFWTRDGEAVKKVAHAASDSTLQLGFVQPTDSGQYRCDVSNGVGNDSIVYTVLVYSLPKLRRELEYSVKARLKANATMVCDVDGHPAPLVTWYKDGEKLEPEVAKMTMDGNTLTVRDVELSDAGNYSCFAVNSAGLLVVPFGLQIFEPPRVTLAERAVATEGHDLVLECTVTGQPPPGITWYRLGQEVTAEGLVRARGGRLTVQSFTHFDRGEYECFAKSPAGTDRAVIDVDFIEVPKLEIFGAAEEMMEIPVGVPIQLDCPVDTDFLGEYAVEWLHGSEPLQGAAYVVDDLQLELTYPVPSDAGDITCVVENQAGSVQYLFKLDVVYPPRLTASADELARPVQVEEGLPVSLLCQVEGNPPPTVVWFNQSRPIVAETGRIKFPSARELLLEEVRRSDAEQLSCLARNALGNATQAFSLDVLTWPAVAVPAQVEVQAGEQARLPCAIDGNPQPTRVWYTGDDAIALPPGAISGNYAHVADTGELLVAAASLDDLGVYTCVASSFVGSARGRSALKVLVAPFIEGASEEPEDVLAREGSSVTFRCPVSGHPPPTITWYKDEDVLREPDTLADGGQALTLRRLTAAAAGQYVCVAASRAGTARKLFSLRVNEAPQTQTATEDVDVDVDASVTLTCPSAGPLVFSTVWLRHGRPAGRRPQLVLGKVQKKDGGKYQCVSSSMARSRVTKYNVRVKAPPRLIADAPPASAVRPRLGYPLRLTCPIEGVAQVRWLRDGQLLSDPFRIVSTMNGRLLFLLSVTEADSGQYSCEARNSAGRASHQFDVQVVVPPYFETPGPDRVKAKVGDELTLTCDVIGQPQPNITWFKDSSVISRKHKLDISPVDVSADGLYTCEAANEAGRAEHNVVVDVIEAPSIEGKPAETVRVPLGGSTLLPCSTKTLLPSISWLKSGEPVSLASPRLRLTPEGLQLTRALTADRGKYRCVVENEAGRAERFVRLVVSAPVQREEKSLYLVVGEQMALSCPELDPSDGPLEEVKWTVKTQAGKKAQPGTGAILKVARVKLSHAGRYACQVTSASGDVKATVWKVHVRDSIDMFLEPAGTVTSSEGDQLTLTCQTDSGAGVQLVWFRNDTQLDVRSAKYANSAGRTKGSVVVSSLVIDDVTESDMGQYVCRALAGDVTEEQPVQVLVTGSPQISSSSPPELTLTPGQRLELHCDASGRPPPVLRWFRGQTALEKDAERVTIGNGTLSVEPFQLEDAGEYMCVAVSAIGKDAKLFNIEAQMVPTFTETPNDVVVPKMGKSSEAGEDAGRAASAGRHPWRAELSHNHHRLHRRNPVAEEQPGFQRGQQHLCGG
ncbi:hemicentin-2-like isoform X2 [Pollicipes pollicipes]|uniref:hemicentin-2-like isoform X2 n=1 Tax=Pollicipes pollicipes TaxID=41117 RepID=UPI001884E4B0|nr:hemicentin-2-like isoform X2 [Pollicipes pollicipes]